jgi:transcription elongation factor Elf1
MKQIVMNAVFNVIKAKAMPKIKAFACMSCGSIASVIVKGNNITVNKCACVKAGV